MTHIRSRRWLPMVALVVAALGTASCVNPWKPLIAGRGIPDPAPTPNSAENVLRLFEWCYEQREPFIYRELFTADYRFVFDAADSAGNAYLNRPWTRDDEVESTTRLFQEVVDIDLTFDKRFRPQVDYRHPQPDSFAFYKSIRTTVVLRVKTEDGATTDVQGWADFFLVRGDIALIPEELSSRGFRPDANRWYINRWEDKTAASGPAPAARLRGPTSAPAADASVAMAGQQITWGWLKVYFHPGSAAPGLAARPLASPAASR